MCHASSVNEISSKKTSMSSAERNRASRYRKKAAQAAQSATVNHQHFMSCSSEDQRGSTEASHTHDTQNRDCSLISYWEAATEYFKKTMAADTLGSVCDICERIWFRSDLKAVKQAHLAILESLFGSESQSFQACSSCLQSLNRSRLPNLSVTNGFRYPPKPIGLPELDPMTARLVSPRVPFMTIRRLRRDGQYGIVGHCFSKRMGPYDFFCARVTAPVRWAWRIPTRLCS
jgi:hypothetical protein